jgi:hypothetical protein
LLRDENLVWSSDMQDIKNNLADLMIAAAAQGDVLLTLADTLAKKVISTEPTDTVLANYNPDLETR